MLSPDSARLVPFVYQMLGFEQIKFLAVFVRRCNPKRVVFRALFCEPLGRSDSGVDFVHEAFVFDRTNVADAGLGRKPSQGTVWLFETTVHQQFTKNVKLLLNRAAFTTG